MISTRGAVLAVVASTSALPACHVARNGGPAPDARGCLAAVIAHDEHTEDADGVTHDVRYSERFYRCEDHVWTERVLPAGRAAHDDAHHGHRELPPMHKLGKLISRAPSGETTLTLVSREERQSIEMSAPSYDLAGFHGDFVGASHLLAPSAIAEMAPLDGKSAPAGARWYEKKSPTAYVRILWSTAYDFPLEVESGAVDGSKRDHFAVALQPVPERFPWDEMQGYAKAHDSDFMD